MLSTITGLLLLSFSTAAAESNPDFAGRLMVADAEATGDVSQQGQLLGLYRLDSAMPSVNPDVSFDLVASSVRVETYESEVSLEEGGVRITQPDPNYEPQRAEYRNAVVESQGQTRSGYKWAIVAADNSTLTADGACVQYEQLDRDTFEAEWKVSPPDAPVAIDVSGSVRWTECASSSVVITGNFVMVLWQVNATLTADNQRVDLPSGYDVSGATPGPTSQVLHPTVSRVRQQYLFVEGGTLTFIMDDTPHFAYLKEADLETTGEIRFSNAAGEILRGSSAHDVSAALLVASGTDLHLTTTRADRGSALAVQLAGSGTLTADGQPLTFATTSTNQARFPWLFGALGAAVLVSAPPIIVPLRRRIIQARTDGAAEKCKSLVDGIRFEEALAWGEKAVRLAPRHPVAHFEVARALEKLGRVEQAQIHRGEADLLLKESGDRELRAENAFQAAEAAAVTGREQAAIRWLRTALGANPSLASDALAVPAFQPLMELLDAERVTVHAPVPYWLQP